MVYYLRIACLGKISPVCFKLLHEHTVTYALCQHPLHASIEIVYETKTKKKGKHRHTEEKCSLPSLSIGSHGNTTFLWHRSSLASTIGIGCGLCQVEGDM